MQFLKYFLKHLLNIVRNHYKYNTFKILLKNNNFQSFKILIIKIILQKRIHKLILHNIYCKKLLFIIFCY